ncbi:phosphatidylinositol-3-phosphatase SAC1-like [Artemia franciscana]|uniref:Phosphatidylinositol-3-phosphatase SAC1 n=1 Tax=Artemia franciscana TaxID=6661 RepID=A0AA88L2W1_ARTSF|nr:hypothetical protein QYM36_012391 [Artemia franciscana]
MSNGRHSGGFSFYTTNEELIFQRSDTGGKGFGKVLKINKFTSEVTVCCDNPGLGQLPRKQIYGIYGMFETITGSCLILVTDAEEVGCIQGWKVWCVKDTEFVEYGTESLTKTNRRNKNTLMSMVSYVLSVPYHYFSFGYKLSCKMQRDDIPDDHFIWNKTLRENFAKGDEEVSKFVLIIVHGYISIKQDDLYTGKEFNWAVISRRSRYNAGTLSYTTGINLDGHAANFVETEQIVECEGDVASFVQTRGSAPVLWNNLPNLKLKPSIVIDCMNDHMTAFSKHFEQQINYYGHQVLVNLISERGLEAELCECYENLVKSYNKKNARPWLSYEGFDFNQECGKWQWDRLSNLIDRTKHHLENYGYLHLGPRSSLTKKGQEERRIEKKQTGVFRTNCLASLDRTNIFQAMLAYKNLEIVFKRLGILGKESSLHDYHFFGNGFKNVWANNADVLALQYSGSIAMKTDQTYAGELHDSLHRYCNNNFKNGFRQDALDYFHGLLRIEEDAYVAKPETSLFWTFAVLLFWTLVYVISFGNITYPDLVNRPNYKKRYELEKINSHVRQKNQDPILEIKLRID